MFQIDPLTGALIQNHGAIGFGGVMGLAFWSGDLYGFSGQGKVFRLSWSGSTLGSTELSLTKPPSPSFIPFGAASSPAL